MFAVGDATNSGADIAISAIGEAKGAALMVDRYLSGEAMDYESPFLVKSDKDANDFVSKAKQPRARMPHRSAVDRKKDFLEINYGLSEDEARREASRCLECGCMDYFECKLLNYANRYNVDSGRYSGIMHDREVIDNDPYIRRNPEKCILCGLCVRVCEEVAGANAIGFMQRGFDTVIKPAFDADLSDTDCISCGQCVSVCPTGALTETLLIDKQVPLMECMTESACVSCSMGCKTRLMTAGSLILRSLPSEDGDALLCVKGRFGIGDINKTERLSAPLVRIDTGMEESSYDKAIARINDAFKDLNTRYGEGSIAVSISNRYTNEEAFLIKEYAEKVLKTDLVFSFGQLDSGLKEVLGRDASSATVDGLKGADLIVLAAPSSDLYRSVYSMRIRSAVRKGAKLILLSSDSDGEEAMLDDIVSLHVEMGDESTALRGIAKALIDSGKGAGVAGIEDLSSTLKGLVASDDCKAAADMILGAGKAVYIFEKEAITAEAAAILADIAVLGGHASGDASGIIQVLSGGNAQGLIDMGVKDRSAFDWASAQGKVRGMFVFGEDVTGLDFAGIEFLAVQDYHMTDIARQADVVLPAASFTEKDGSLTASGNITRELHKAVAGPVDWDGIKQIRALAEAAGAKLPYKGLKDVRKAVDKAGASYTAPAASALKLVAAKEGALSRS